MDLHQIRKHIHQYPELSGEEKNTSNFIAQKLKGIGITTIYQNFSEHSIIAEIRFKKEGKTVLFRSELDALPIEETNQFDYVSNHSNISHKCGHDGHMTILLGFAEKIKQAPLDSGTVLLLFQSSEETGKGAKSIVESKMLKKFNIDFVFSLHNVPGYPLGSVICKAESFTPSVESVDIHLYGKTSHAGMPEKGINPSSTVSKLINYFETIHNDDIYSEDFFLATPIHIQMGSPAYGTSAGEAVLSYTLRTWKYPHFLNQKKEIIRNISEIISKQNGLTHSLEWKEAFDANYNSIESYQLIKKAAEMNSYTFIEKETPFCWGEDFGTFTQNYNGAMFCLGSGENIPELHNPDYDFPDELIEIGASMFYTIAKQVLT